MRTKFLIFALFSVISLSINAQSETYQNYLDKAMMSLENGDCEASKKWYNVYKELSGKTISSVEVLIQDCNNTSSGTTQYAINDKINIDGYLYRVAYIEDGGTHGFAIYDLGAGPFPETLADQRKLPTRSEMALLAVNAEKVMLDKQLYFWTLDIAGVGQHYSYKLADKKVWADGNGVSNGVLLIYRF